MPFTIVVNEPLAPTINSAQPRTAIEGVVYDPPFTFTASDGLAPLVWSETGPLPGLAFSLDGVLSGTPSGAGIFPISLDVKDALNRSAPSAPVTVRVAYARPPASFTATGSMSVARFGHAATLLTDGKVLITGGDDGSGSGLASAELYDPLTGLFTATTGSMSVARARHTATLLNSGKVLIAGGDRSGAASAELYDPVTGTFAATGNMTVARAGSTATLLTGATLPNYGKVLIAGGDLSGTAAELYDPVTATFAATGSMTDVRTLHLATLLLDGKVLMVGGGPTSAETYDPMAGVFTVTTGDLAVANPQTASRMIDGRVLITGTSAAAQLFDPATGLFAVVGSLAAGGAVGSTATLRNDDSVLVAGGADLRPFYMFSCGWSGGHFRCTYRRSGSRLASLSPTEQFAPECEGFIATGILTRDGHTATLLADGSVLVAGGVNHSVVGNPPHTASATVLSSAELYR
jgi:hypothetical protein